MGSTSRLSTPRAGTRCTHLYIEARRLRSRTSGALKAVLHLPMACGWCARVDTSSGLRALVS